MTGSEIPLPLIIRQNPSGEKDPTTNSALKWKTWRAEDFTTEKNKVYRYQSSQNSGGSLVAKVVLNIGMGLSRGRRSTKICRKPWSRKGFLLVRLLTYLKLNKSLTFHPFTGVLARPKSHDLQEQQNNSCQIWLICTVSQKEQKKEYYSFFFCSHSHAIFPYQLKSISSRSRERKGKQAFI